jgi:hypothetical protein
MSDPNHGTPGVPGPGRAVHRLRVEGRLNGLAPDDIEDLKLAVAVSPTVPEVTTLTCELPDQRALVRLINQLHNLGLPLVSVERL